MADLTKVFITTFFLVFCVSTSFSIICSETHPQKTFCNADFAIRGVIIKTGSDVKEDPFDYMVYNQVLIKKVYKGRNLLQIDGNNMVIVTHPKSALIKWPLGKEYLLSGQVNNKEGRTTECDWVKPWSQVTLVQRWGLKRHYEPNCGCDIKFCRAGKPCTLESIGCKWNPDDVLLARENKDCTSMNYVCFLNRGPMCRWYTVPNLRCESKSDGTP